METILDAVDFIVILLAIVHVTRAVWKEQLEGSSSLLLTACIALAACIFAIISYTSFMGLVATVSSLTQMILLVALLAMIALVSLSWESKPVA